MRLTFISRLALLTTAVFGVVATQVFATHAWSEETLEVMFIAGGGIAIALALIDAYAGSLAQRLLDVPIALLGAFAVVQAVSFGGNELKWWSFGTAAALAGLSIIGLVLHELSTERVVHELSVTGSPEVPQESSLSAAR
jgi:hypothetical protein